MTKYILTFFILLLNATMGICQSKYILSGKVTDAKNAPLSVADAFILTTKDTSLVKYTGIADGRFAFDSIEKGDYILKISAFGFQEYFQAVNLDNNKELSILLKEELQLKEATITAAKRTIVNKNGNTTINVENSYLSTLPNTVDMLAKLPGIQLSSDKESLSIVGRGEPLIYIDNQRMTMNDLSALPVNDIKTIEIITNPSAKYEAEGRAVVLVTRKANREGGLKAEVFETAAFRPLYNNYMGGNLNFKKKRLELKANVQYNQFTPWEGTVWNSSFPAKGMIANASSQSPDVKTQYITGGGIYYQLNDDDYISLNASNRAQFDHFSLFSESYYQDPDTTYTVTTDSRDTSSRPYFNTNLNYSHKFKKMNALLFTGAKYSSFTRALNSHIYNNFNNTGEQLEQDRYQRYHIDAVTGRIDFEKVFKKELKWETGANITHAKAFSLLDLSSYTPEVVIRSRYDYLEQNYAAYTQVSGKRKKISYEAGLRMEKTQVAGGFKDSLEKLIDKNYTQLFPRMNMDIEIDSTKSLRLNYGRTISRPNYSNASQISTYLTPFLEFSRNININPCTANGVSANFQYKKYSVETRVFWQKNPVYYIIEYMPQEERLRMINTNLQSERGINIDLNIPIEYRKWSSSNQLSSFITQVSDTSAVMSKARPVLYFHTYHQFSLPKGYSVVATGWVVSARRIGVYELSPIGQLDIGFSKTFFKNLSCTLNFNDIFRTMGGHENFTTNGIHHYEKYTDYSREVSLSLRYSFGKLSGSKYKNKEVDDNAGRVN